MTEKTVTFVDAGGNWEMLFVDNECVVEGHSVEPYEVAEELKNVDYNEIRNWSALYNNIDFVEYNDQVAQYLRTNGVGFLFEE